MTEAGVAPLPEVVFGGSRLRLTLERAGTNRLMVTFDHRQPNRTGFADLKSRDRYTKAGYDHLHLTTTRPDWFIGPETRKVEAVMARLAGNYAQVSAIGFSMGAYAAFRFAAVLRVTSIAAVSPIWSIHPDHAPWEKRYLDDLTDFDPDLGAIPPRRLWSAGPSGVIFVDPWFRSDMAHARQLVTAFPQVTLCRLPGGGHPATGLLAAAKRTGLVLDALGQTPPDAARLQSAHRALRLHSKDYRAKIARHLEKRSKRRAARQAVHDT